MEHAAYLQELVDGYESEIMADAMLDIVCQRLGVDDPHYASVRLIQKLEITLAKMMKQLLISYGQPVPDGVAARAAGTEASQALTSWASIQESARQVMPPVVERFNTLAANANDKDKAILELFALHEQLLLKLGLAQLETDPTASERAVFREIEKLIQDVETRILV